MKLAEALRIVHGAMDGPLSRLYLACSFEPLHLQTFLHAHCQQARPGRRLEVCKGLYGDLVVNLESKEALEAEALAVVMEWPDLDPRFGMRMPAVWNAGTLKDMAQEAGRRLDRMGAAFAALPAALSPAACLPTLPFPPVGFTAPVLANELELEMEEKLAVFRRRVASCGVRWLSASALAIASPASARYDGKSDLATGLPYSLAHADQLAHVLARLLFPPAPKKGIITDLDNTLWLGIAGEVGPEGVHWDLDHKSRSHGLYQQVLRSLSESGVLVGAASKNDPAVVGKIFEREDLILRREYVFPLEVHWGPKSSSVERIARVWNIGLDSIVFVDDSAMECAEVERAHPEVECLGFPGDPAGVEALCRRLRELFGRDRVTEEDRLRLASIRRNQEWNASASTGEANEDFLAGLQATLVIDARRTPPDPRALELLNKTNQFNLNGRRREEGEWRRFLGEEGAFCWLVSYEDRFGPLGKIAVLAGRRNGNGASVEHWVMSCRAFSRRIEYACLRQLFEALQVEMVELDFAPTPRNGPLQQFLAPWRGETDSAKMVVARAAFESRCPALHHITKEPLHER